LSGVNSGILRPIYKQYVPISGSMV